MASIAYVTAARRSDSVCRETATWAISAKASPASWWSVLSALDTGGLRPGFGWQRKGFTACGGERRRPRGALWPAGAVAWPRRNNCDPTKLGSLHGALCDGSAVRGTGHG